MWTRRGEGWNNQATAEVEAEAEEKGWVYMHDKLSKIDPDSASRIDRNDTQRIQRALEVYEITGNTLTELTATPEKRPFEFPIKKCRSN